MKGDLLPDLIVSARNGSWNWIEANLEKALAEKAHFDWALDAGLADTSERIRELAALLIEKTLYPIGEGYQVLVRREMVTDNSPRVRYRLAVGLWKRDNREVSVRITLLEARNNLEFGEIAETARKLLAGGAG